MPFSCINLFWPLQGAQPWPEPVSWWTSFNIWQGHHQDRNPIQGETDPRFLSRPLSMAISGFLGRTRCGCVDGSQGTTPWSLVAEANGAGSSLFCFCSSAEFRFLDERFLLKAASLLLWEPSEAPEASCCEKAWFCCHLLSLSQKQLCKRWGLVQKPSSEYAVLVYLGLFFMSRFLCFLPKSSYPLKIHHKSDLTEALSIEKFRINFLLFKSDLRHGSRDSGQGSSTNSLSAEHEHMWETSYQPQK